MTYTTGEMVLPKNAVVMDQEEMRYVEGGGAIAILLAGCAVGWLIDGVVKAATGLSITDWVANGLKVGCSYVKTVAGKYYSFMMTRTGRLQVKPITYRR